MLLKYSPFLTIYVYNIRFSLYNLTKTIYNNKLNEEASIFSIKPDIRVIYKYEKECHPSH